MYLKVEKKFIVVALESKDEGILLPIHCLEDGVEGKDDDIYLFDVCISVNPAHMVLLVCVLNEKSYTV